MTTKTAAGLALHLSEEQARAFGFFLQHLPLPHIDAIARTEGEAVAIVDAASVILDALAPLLEAEEQHRLGQGLLDAIAANRAKREGSA